MFPNGLIICPGDIAEVICPGDIAGGGFEGLEVPKRLLAVGPATFPEDRELVAAAQGLGSGAAVMDSLLCS